MWVVASKSSTWKQTFMSREGCVSMLPTDLCHHVSKVTFHAGSHTLVFWKLNFFQFPLLQLLNLVFNSSIEVGDLNWRTSLLSIDKFFYYKGAMCQQREQCKYWHSWKYSSLHLVCKIPVSVTEVLLLLFPSNVQLINERKRKFLSTQLHTNLHRLVFKLKNQVKWRTTVTILLVTRIIKTYVVTASGYLVCSSRHHHWFLK